MAAKELSTLEDIQNQLVSLWQPISERHRIKINDPNNLQKPNSALTIAFFELLNKGYFNEIGVDWQKVSGLSSPYPTGLLIYALTETGIDLKYLYKLENPNVWQLLLEEKASDKKFKKIIKEKFGAPSSVTYPGRYQVIPPLVSVLLHESDSLSIVDFGGSIGSGLPYSEIIAKSWDKLNFQGKNIVPIFTKYKVRNGVSVDKIDYNDPDIYQWVISCIWPGEGSLSVPNEIKSGLQAYGKPGNFHRLQADLTETCTINKILRQNHDRQFDIAASMFLRYTLPTSLSDEGPFENLIQKLVRPGGIWISEGDGLLEGRTSAPWDVQVYRVEDKKVVHLGSPFDLTTDQQRIGMAKPDFWSRYNKSTVSLNKLAD